MTDFDDLVRHWIKTSGFLAHEFVKRFLIIYPLFCFASNCYIQVQVAFFEDWFGVYEPDPEAVQSNGEELLPTQTSSQEFTESLQGGQVADVDQPVSQNSSEDNDAEEPINIQKALLAD